MDAILDLFDTSAKRWLAVLVAALLISIVFLERSFMSALAPGGDTVTAQESTSSETPQAQPRTELAEDNQAQAHGQEEGAIVNRVSPFDSQRPTTAPKNDPGGAPTNRPSTVRLSSPAYRCRQASQGPRQSYKGTGGRDGEEGRHHQLGRPQPSAYLTSSRLAILNFSMRLRNVARVIPSRRAA